MEKKKHPGRKENLRTPTPEEARAMQLKSAAKRKENRTFRQILEEKLKTPGRKENIIERLIQQAEAGNLAAYDRLNIKLQEDKDETSTASSSVVEITVPKDVADVIKALGDE